MRLDKFSTGFPASDVLVAADRLWEARRAIIDALNHESPVNYMEDVVAPPVPIRHPRRTML